MITVIILTKNEARDLPGCLRSVDWSDDVYVVDSGSADATVELARRAGATVLTHPFRSFGQQRNYALDVIVPCYDWLLFLDADERVTPAFLRAMTSAIADAPTDVAGFYLCWKMMLDGQWLRRCDNFPKWQFRLMRRGRARFTDFGHGQKEHNVDGRIDYLREPYDHYGFSKGWSHWIDRHNRYSTAEAMARLHSRPPFRSVFSAHGSVRNPALRSWLSRLPGWPLLRFFQAYLFNLGFLEGMPGFLYCVNIAYYEFLIGLKMREIRLSGIEAGVSVLPNPVVVSPSTESR